MQTLWKNNKPFQIPIRLCNGKRGGDCYGDTFCQYPQNEDQCEREHKTRFLKCTHCGEVEYCTHCFAFYRQKCPKCDKFPDEKLLSQEEQWAVDRALKQKKK
jgi:phage FluMu protein Com